MFEECWDEEKYVKEYSDGSGSKGRFLLVFIFRLLLLLVGGSLAALGGVAIAIVRPDPTPEKPLVAKILPLPGDAKNLFNIFNNNSPEQANPQLEGKVILPPAKLTPQQKQQLETDLNQLQTQLNNLRDRTTTIEKQLGTENSNEALETRLQTINQQLKPTTQAKPAKSSPPLPSATQIADSPKPLIPSDTLTAILPADALFQDNQAVMFPEARLVLDRLVSELQRYSNSTVRIAVHTDGAGEPQNNTILSFRRAEAVGQYLSNLLGNKYHWVILGYGETRPIAPNDTQINMQRNRRLEIVVEPK